MLFPTPYISTKNYVFTLDDASFPPPLSLLLVIESTSSMNMIVGFDSLAILNNSLINLSDSPTNLDIKSAEDTEKNVP